MAKKEWFSRFAILGSVFGAIAGGVSVEPYQSWPCSDLLIPVLPRACHHPLVIASVIFGLFMLLGLVSWFVGKTSHPYKA